MKAEEVKNMFIAVAKRMIAAEEYLTEIDHAIGDGDHGTGMALGFSRIRTNLENRSFTYVNEVFHTIGMTMLEEMGGASGVLFGTLFISGIIGMEEKEAFALSDFAGVFARSLQALKSRGGAKIGDKTMVDALEPAVNALQAAQEAGLGIEEAFSAAADAAAAGVEYTKRCVARFGRAKYYKEKAIGYQDAGATSVSLIFREMSDYITEENKTG